MSLRVLVCGSRSYANPKYNSDDPARLAIVTRQASVLYAMLDGLYTEYTVGHRTTEMSSFTLIEGAAPGADSAAKWWALNSPMHSHNEHHDDPRFVHLSFPADWDTHGNAAGPIRNQQMLDEGTPDLVLAFIDKPLAESKGTANMVDRARKAGLPVYVTHAT